MTLRRTATVFFLLLTGCHRGEDAGKTQEPQEKSAAAEKKQGEISISVEAQQEAGIVLETVHATTGPDYLNVVGQMVLNDNQTAHVGSYTDGRVIRVMANVGDHVKRGAVLAQMHSHDVHETLAAYRTAKENVARQGNSLAFQQRQKDRMARLLDLKSASKVEVDKAESDVRAAQTDLGNAQIAVQREVAHLTDILHFPASEIDHINEENDEVPVICPFDGTVVERKINEGSVVEPGDEVFVISNLTSVWMIASVAENDLAKVRVGERAEIQAKAFPEERFSGRVTRISVELDPRTRTLPVRILVPNPQLKLKIAMFVNARIVRGSGVERIFLNEEALQDINGMAVVFINKSGDVFEARPVEIGQRLYGQAEIRAGLKPMEKVVTRGSFIVKSEFLKSQIGE